MVQVLDTVSAGEPAARDEAPHPQEPMIRDPDAHDGAAVGLGAPAAILLRETCANRGRQRAPKGSQEIVSVPSPLPLVPPTRTRCSVPSIRTRVSSDVNPQPSALSLQG